MTSLDGRWRWAAGGLGGAVALLFAGALWFLRAPRPADRSAEASLASREPAEESQAASPREDSYAQAQGSLSTIPNPMSLDQFLAVVSEEVPKDIADDFVAEFSQDSSLEEEWRRAQQDRKAPAAEFITKVGKSDKLEKLLLKYDQKPAFRAAWERLIGRTDIDRLLHAEVPESARRARESLDRPLLAKLPEAASRARESMGTNARAIVVAQAGAGSQASTGSRFAEALQGAGLARGGGARSAAVADSRNPASSSASGQAGEPGPISTPEAGSGGRRGAGSPGTAASGEAEALAALPLAELTAAGPDETIGGFPVSAWNNLDVATKRMIEELCVTSGCTSPYTCHRIGRLAQCQAACSAAASLGHPCSPYPEAEPPPPPPPPPPAGGGGGAQSPPTATGYGANGEVWNGSQQVMNYGPGGEPREGAVGWGSVTLPGGDVVGTFYNFGTTGVVENSTGQVIYEFDNQGTVWTCPCN